MNESRRDPILFWIIILLGSLFVHFVVLVAICAAMMLNLASWRPHTSDDLIPVSTINLVKARDILPAPRMPQEPSFVPTPDRNIVKDNPNARLESDKSTEKRSEDQARDPNSPMPDMKGSHSALNYDQTMASAAVQSQPTPPSPPQKPTPPTPPTPPKEQTPQTPPQPAKPQEAAQPAPQVKPPVVSPPDAIPALPPEKQPEKVEPPKPRTDTPRPPEPRRPPPSAASFAQSRSDTRGSGMTGAPSPEARETEMGRYKARMYRAVGSRWHWAVASNLSTLAMGTVKIRFFVQANGVVRDIEVVEDSGANNGSTAILRTISVESIIKSAPFEPFSESMKQQLGAGYSEEFTFSVY